MITKDDMRRDAEICKAATPGPWFREDAQDEGLSEYYPSNNVASAATDDTEDVLETMRGVDADFVVRAREALPAYVREMSIVLFALDTNNVPTHDGARPLAIYERVALALKVKP